MDKIYSVLALAVVLCFTPLALAQSVRAPATNAPGAAKEAPDGGEAATPEGAEDGKKSDSETIKTRIKVTLKNGSSFQRRLSVRDDVCNRSVAIAKKFRAWGRERFTLCANLLGFGAITVTHSMTGRKWRFLIVKDGEELRL